MRQEEKLRALRGTAEEALGGLRADETMRRAILSKAERPVATQKHALRWAPVLACAALIAVVAAGGSRRTLMAVPEPTPIVGTDEPILALRAGAEEGQKLAKASSVDQAVLLPLPEAVRALGEEAEILLPSGRRITGDEARQALETLMSAERVEETRDPEETITLQWADGTQMQLGRSGDLLMLDGAWRCPAFIEAIDAK